MRIYTPDCHTYTNGTLITLNIFKWIPHPPVAIHSSVSHVLLQRNQLSIFFQVAVRHHHPGVVLEGLGLAQHTSGWATWMVVGRYSEKGKLGGI